MKRILLTSALLAAFAAATLSHAADTPGSNPSIRAPSVAERIASARKALDAKEHASAMRELQAALRDDPRNADIHNLMGYTYRTRAQPDLVKSIEHYQAGLRIDPKHRGLHEYIGQAYLMDKKPAQAEVHLAEIEKLCGNKTCEEYQELSKALVVYKAKNGG
jgi:Tfp pilus assembly protein PilF